MKDQVVGRLQLRGESRVYSENPGEWRDLIPQQERERRFLEQWPDELSELQARAKGLAPTGTFTPQGLFDDNTYEPVTYETWQENPDRYGVYDLNSVSYFRREGETTLHRRTHFEDWDRPGDKVRDLGMVSSKPPRLPDADPSRYEAPADKVVGRWSPFLGWLEGPHR